MLDWMAARCDQDARPVFDTLCVKTFARQNRLHDQAQRGEVDLSLLQALPHRCGDDVGAFGLVGVHPSPGG